MNIGTLAFLSLVLILSVALFLVVLRWPASRAMPISYICAALLALFMWKVSFFQVAAASIKGLMCPLQIVKNEKTMIKQSVRMKMSLFACSKCFILTLCIIKFLKAAFRST